MLCLTANHIDCCIVYLRFKKRCLCVSYSLLSLSVCFCSHPCTQANTQLHLGGPSHPPLQTSLPGVQAYTVRGLAYSPDGCLLAVAQSDAAVFVYRLGTTWGEPKAICNRFAAGTPVTCLVWPGSHAAGPVFGCADGQVGLQRVAFKNYGGQMQIR